MASDVYTKNEILKNLASRGYFIDAYTLETFFKKWKIEAIFEDEQGSEFYDRNTLDIVLNNLFNDKNETAQRQPQQNPHPAPMPQMPQMQMSRQNLNQMNNPNIQMPQYNQMQYQPQQNIHPAPMPQMPNQISYQMPNNPINQAPQQMINPMPQVMPQQQYQQPYMQQPAQNFNRQEPEIKPVQPQMNNVQNVDTKKDEFGIDDEEAKEILNNISMSDGKPLSSKIKETSKGNDFLIDDIPKPEPEIDIELPSKEIKKPKSGILAGALELAGKTIEPDELNPDVPKENASIDQLMADFDDTPDTGDFDDMSLLSESLEAQEKLRQYVVDELSKKNLDVTPKPNEFKLDISERTLSMIARTMAKKIAKHVSTICSQDAKAQIKLTEIQEQNKKLEQRAKELEEQNKKLRLLLAESNKNLNSYKPSIFGFYKKVNS